MEEKRDEEVDGRIREKGRNRMSLLLLGPTDERREEKRT